MTDAGRRQLTRRGHLHVEAFCIMQYESDDRTVKERLWNSRDGVTPFVIRSQDGTKELTHVRFQEDVYAPGHVPQDGDRVFVDMTKEAAREYAEKRVEAYWMDATYPLSDRFETKDAAIAYFVEIYTEREGAPNIITVTEDTRKIYGLSTNATRDGTSGATGNA